MTFEITGSETQPKLRTRIPGPTSKKIVKKDEQYMLTTTKTAPVTAVRGRGVVVQDADDNVFLDFTSGIGVLNTGHCHPHVVAKIQEQASNLMHFAGTDFYYDQQAELARRLDQVVPIEGDTKTFFCQSGTEANEAAIKVVKNATGRPRLLSFIGGFHGRTQGSLSLTGSKVRQKEGFFPTMPGVTHVPFPNPYRNMWGIDGYEDPKELTNRALDYIETLFQTILPAEEVAGMWWEPVQGEGGYIVPPSDFYPELEKILHREGILSVADEVQTGFGRTGKMFGSEHYKVKPDVLCLAKAMGSGMPIGACVARHALDFDARGRHSNTYGGNLVGCASALATLDVFEQENLVERSAEMGDYLGHHLNHFLETYEGIGDHRGLGLMRAIEFITKNGDPNPALRDRVEKEAWKRGLLLLGCGKSSIRFIPSLVINNEQIDGAMGVLDEALRAAKA